MFDCFDRCIDAISKATILHDYMWSGVQYDTLMLCRTRIYLVSMISNQSVGIYMTDRATLMVLEGMQKYFCK
jgi:hypothetical protein